MIRLLAVLGLAACCSNASTRLLVTVVEQRTGKPVTGLAAGDFTVFDGRSERTVEGAAFTRDMLDIMLLLDTSLMGGMVQPVAESMVAEIQPKEQMAVVSFHSSADLIQDFTSSKELLRRALAGVKYGNSPHVLDALYAAIDGGFQQSAFRRVILLLTAGVEGSSRVGEREVLRMARSQGVSIFPIYMVGDERSMFENLARQTGGASFNLRAMEKAQPGGPTGRIFEAARGHYVLTLSGNLSLGEKLKVDVKRQEKVFVSALPLE
jgi:VWFA-related protein